MHDKMLNLMRSTNIRMANEVDTKSILDIYRTCAIKLQTIGIHQWNNTYPTEDVLRKEISNQEVFVYGDQYQACITLNERFDPEHEQVIWNHPNLRSIYMHRLAVHPQYWKQGLGKKMCAFAEVYARLHGFECIRLDTYEENPASLAFYKSLGYSQAQGNCYFRGSSVACLPFDKVLV